MIYTNRIPKILRDAGSVFVTADTLLELEAYLCLVGYSSYCIKLPTKDNHVVLANAPSSRLRGEYKTLGDAEFIMKAARLAGRVHLEHGRVLALDPDDAFYKTYVKWAVANNVDLPIEHLPVVRPVRSNVDDQVKVALVRHVREGNRHGDKVTAAYLAAREITTSIGTVRRLLKSLVADGVLRTSKPGNRLLSPYNYHIRG